MISSGLMGHLACMQTLTYLFHAALQHKNHLKWCTQVLRKHFVRCMSKNSKDTYHQNREKKECGRGAKRKKFPFNPLFSPSFVGWAPSCTSSLQVPLKLSGAAQAFRCRSSFQVPLKLSETLQHRPTELVMQYLMLISMLTPGK